MSYINREIFTKESKSGRVYTLITYILFLSTTKSEIKSEYAGVSRLLASLMRRKTLANTCIHASSRELQQKDWIELISSVKTNLHLNFQIVNNAVILTSKALPKSCESRKL
jgi:hypothetical protein